jgi:hypothetical protein
MIWSEFMYFFFASVILGTNQFFAHAAPDQHSGFCREGDHAPGANNMGSDGKCEWVDAPTQFCTFVTDQMAYFLKLHLQVQANLTPCQANRHGKTPGSRSDQTHLKALLAYLHILTSAGNAGQQWKNIDSNLCDLAARGREYCTTFVVYILWATV